MEHAPSAQSFVSLPSTPSTGSFSMEEETTAAVPAGAAPLLPRPHVCAACDKAFATGFSLTRHWKRMPVCAQWLAMSQLRSAAPAAAAAATPPPVVVIVPTPPPSEPVNTWVHAALRAAMAVEGGDGETEGGEGGVSCRWCTTRFASTGNLHKHFATATACNRFARDAVLVALNASSTAATRASPPAAPCRD